MVRVAVLAFNLRTNSYRSIVEVVPESNRIQIGLNFGFPEYVLMLPKTIGLTWGIFAFLLGGFLISLRA